jgi:DNA polymerase
VRILYNINTLIEYPNYGALIQACLTCTACKLSSTRTQVVPGEGIVPAHIMFIGEGPGEQEDLQGKPFVGRSGKLLTQMMNSVGLDRTQNSYIANIVKCRPPGNRAPEPDEVAACLPWLKEQIRLVAPKILVLVGATALKALLGQTQSITKMRGTWLQYEGIDTTVIFHPSYLLRYPSQEKDSPKWQTWQDLKALKKAYEFYLKTGELS